VCNERDRKPEKGTQQQKKQQKKREGNEATTTLKEARSLFLPVPPPPLPPLPLPPTAAEESIDMMKSGYQVTERRGG
jgi:hypothetical protein